MLRLFEGVIYDPFCLAAWLLSSLLIQQDAQLGLLVDVSTRDHGLSLIFTAGLHSCRPDAPLARGNAVVRESVRRAMRRPLRITTGRRGRGTLRTH